MHLVLIGSECFKFDSEVVFLSSVMNRIAEILLDWYAREGRDLPWRRTRDPYRIWLSEVILQQTRVAQGMEYYLRFTERFPDVASLAAAPADAGALRRQDGGEEQNRDEKGERFVCDFSAKHLTNVAKMRQSG